MQVKSLLQGLNTPIANILKALIMPLQLSRSVEETKREMI